jgi:hypothetical protein
MSDESLVSGVANCITHSKNIRLVILCSEVQMFDQMYEFKIGHHCRPAIFRTLFGSNMRLNFWLSVRIGIDGQNFGPISVRIGIGHIPT